MNQNNFDTLLNVVLKEEAGVEPLAGFEERVLRQIVQDQRPAGPAKAAWLAGAVTVAVLAGVSAWNLSGVHQGRNSTRSAFEPSEGATLLGIPRSRSKPSWIAVVPHRKLKSIQDKEQPLEVAPVQIVPLSVDALYVQPLLK